MLQRLAAAIPGLGYVAPSIEQNNGSEQVEDSQEIAAYVVDLIIEREDETKKANIADRIRQQEVYDREYALADEFSKKERATGLIMESLDDFKDANGEPMFECVVTHELYVPPIMKEWVDPPEATTEEYLLVKESLEDIVESKVLEEETQRALDKVLLVVESLETDVEAEQARLDTKREIEQYPRPLYPEPLPAPATPLDEQDFAKLEMCLGRCGTPLCVKHFKANILGLGLVHHVLQGRFFPSKCGVQGCATTSCRTGPIDKLEEKSIKYPLYTNAEVHRALPIINHLLHRRRFPLFFAEYEKRLAARTTKSTTVTANDQ